MELIYGLLELVGLYVAAVAFGEFISWIPRYLQQDKEGFKYEIPTFLGQLLGGIIMANLPGGLVGDIPVDVSQFLREICLSIILIRAGLGLDLKILGTVGGTTLSLACIPCILEAIVAAVLCKLFKPSTPWGFCFALGFVQSAVSPAVVVPNVVSLNDSGYGVAKGIPTMILAACSIDVLLSVAGIGVSVDLAFSELEGGGNESQLTNSMIVLFSTVIGGTVAGYILGVLQAQVTLWACTDTDTDTDTGAMCLHQWLKTSTTRTVVLLLASLVIVTVATMLELEAGAYLCTMTMALMAAQGWNELATLPPGELDNTGADGHAVDLSTKPVSALCKELWVYCQPILLSLIGIQVIISDVESSDVAVSFGILIIAVLFRLAVTYGSVSTTGGHLNSSERLFVAISWFPKATAQAAFGSVVLDTASKMTDDANEARGEEIGKLILTTAVISILFTAPIGAIAIPMMGPRLLTRAESGALPIPIPIEPEPEL